MASGSNLVGSCFSIVCKLRTALTFLNGSGTKLFQTKTVICDNSMKLKFQCPQTLGCHSKSKRYATFSVFILDSSHTSLWRGNRRFLHWHEFWDYTGEHCLRAPRPGLLWLCSRPRSEDAAEQGVARTWSQQAPGITLRVFRTLESTEPR